MNYTIERYRNCQRFNDQYPEIYQFLLRAEQLEYNEHFPWGRFEWMQMHSFLEEKHLTNILLFRDSHNEIVGMATYDTLYDDRFYLIHTLSDESLLEQMVDAVLENGTATIKVNTKDQALTRVLRQRQFVKTRKDSTLLELDLSKALAYTIPDGYAISPADFAMDPWQYQLVIHKGFDNDGIPEKWTDTNF